jgi:zinc protease
MSGFGFIVGALVALAQTARPSAAPAPAAPPRLEVPYEIFTLKNGLTVIVHEDRSAPIATVNTWYHVGSGRERPGRTGFAHLFEHLMFEGSKNVPEGAFDRWLEGVGGNNNGSTNTDRTNYWEDVPAGALEMPLFLESDRMAFLVEGMTPQKVDGQRDVVKNERRQSYENRPYGMAELRLLEALYPPDHPYSWPTIGSMADLSAAKYDDVVEFFQRWYGPANASVVIAGDVDAKEVRTLAEKWFGDVPARAPVDPIVARPVALKEEKRIVLEDKVQLPRLYLQWPTPPYLSPADASLDAVAGVLALGKNSRLYKRLVYELEVAQDVQASQDSAALASAFSIVATARSGAKLDELRALVDEELQKLRERAPTARELERFRNQVESRFYDRLERIGGFGGKADQLNNYFFATGNPDYFEEDLSRYQALAPKDVQAAALRFLGPNRVVLSVVPEGKRELAVPEKAK